MLFTRRAESLLLFLGDLAVLYLSLWLTLLLRDLAVPSFSLWYRHLVPFSILFAVWIGVYFIAGLYERHTSFFRLALPRLLFKTQLFNVAVAVLFFYLIPYFGITPKTNLFIYLFVSFGLILLWRLVIYGHWNTHHSRPVAVIGSGEEFREFRDEIERNPKNGLSLVFFIDLDQVDARSIDIQQDIVEPVYRDGVKMMAVDLQHQEVGPLLPHLYNLIFSNVQFFDMHSMYQDIFNRVPLSLLRYSWFLENVSASSPYSAYDMVKRLIDILGAGAVGVLFLILHPFIVLAIKLEDGGPVFIRQERVGRNNGRILTTKFRTMTTDDRGEAERKKNNHSTKVGTFLRRTRLDELPQLWDVLRGDLSLIGPRPELPGLVRDYEAQIPYYDIRHLIKPGLSGWAQLYHTDPPKRDADVVKTKQKLSYDIYYIINRSLVLDLVIALKTIKTLLSRSGT